MSNNNNYISPSIPHSGYKQSLGLAPCTDSVCDCLQLHTQEMPELALLQFAINALKFIVKLGAL